QTIEGSCENEWTEIYTWTATDNCGNSDVAVWTINFSDTTSPELNVEDESFDLECNETLDIPEIMAIDNCDEDVAINADIQTIDGDCENEWTEVYTWTATDNCGNIDVAVWTINYSDNTAPELTIPADVTLECDEDLPMGGASATDNCDVDVEITSEDLMIQGDCENAYVIERTFTATDNCGNSTSDVQVITVEDTTAPVFAAYDVEIEMPCDNLMETTVEAIDNCDNDVEITYEDTPVSGGCIGRIIRDFTATDNCGNTATAQQIITLTDEIAPDFTAFPIDMDVECDNVPGVSDMVDAEDNCDDNLLIEYLGEVIEAGDCPQSYTIIRTWRATDSCGNVTERSQTINVNDTTAPELSVPAGYEISCDEDLLLEDASANDNCGVVTLVETEEMIAGACPQAYTLIRSWTATDECGNSTSASQTIEVYDNEAPMFTSVPSDEELSCEEMLPTDLAVAEDNCGIAEVTFQDETLDGDCPNSYTVVRTWTATDECGNSSSASTLYFFYDDQAPVFDQELEDVVVECADDVPALPVVTATDNCGPASVTVDFDVEFEDECGNTVRQVIYTATDVCGNSNSDSFTITVMDETAPILEGTPEENVVLDCEDEVPAPADVIALDNCDDNVELVYEEVIIGEQPTPGSSADCVATTPIAFNGDGTVCNGDEPWAMKLFDFLGNDEVFYSAIEAQWVEFPDGTASLTATLVRNDDPNRGYYANVNFENGLDYALWSSQGFPTGYKDDCNLAGDDNIFEDWTYYIMSAGATLTGWGDNDGNTITLAHAPSSFFYGYQVGVAANNVNGEYGSGGWFTFDGIVDGVEVSGSGDFAFDHDCCPQYEIERTWTATDCSGNTVTFTQNISFADLAAPVATIEGDFVEAREPIAKGEEQFAKIVVSPNPAVAKAMVVFTVPNATRAKVEIFNLSGAKVMELFDAQVGDDQTVQLEMDAQQLPMGIYLYRLTTDTEIITDKLVVKK
ncbi:MAG: T9SS type A sorting domain-containing protein, partial [Flavobacteriales bacterium]|nr:T9SS type A sorting domain-containing protein [Flavobacteriales bacterium]